MSSHIVAYAVEENMKTSSTKTEHDTIFPNNVTITPSTSRNTLRIKSSKQHIATIIAVNGSMTRIKENCGDGEDISSETLNNIVNCSKINKDTSQLQVTFIAQKHIRKPKFETETSGRKQKKISNAVLIIKNIHFKNQRARNMTAKFKRYCKRIKKTFDGPRQIDKELESESILKKVSRTQVLKKMLAKKNKVAEAEANIQSPDNAPSFSIDDDLSFISISSQSTLKQKDSINSVIETKNSKMKPFNTNIINVAVAQISNTPNLNRDSYSVIVPLAEKADFKDSLTSCESAFSQTLELTSKTFLDDTIKLTSKDIISDASCSNSNISNETLIPSKADTAPDNYEIGNRVRSPETINNILPCFTPSCNLINQSQCFKSLNDSHISDDTEKAEHAQTFYNDCMTFNVNPKTRACSSSVPDFPNNDTVIIAEDIVKTTQQIQKMKNRGNERFGNIKKNFQANIFQKPFNVFNENDYQKNLNLPNAAQIKSTIVDTSRPPRKCSQEANDYPANFPELCDKLTIILEIAVKKLEQTLSEKIVNELNRSLYEINKHNMNSNTKFQQDAASEIVTEDIKLECPTRSTATLRAMPLTDAKLQCDIVQNEVIDKLMLTFEEYSKSCDQSSSSNYTHKLKKPKLVKDYFDILKTSLSSQYRDPEIGKGDSVQLSIEDAVEEKVPQFECKNRFWSIPVTILRENMFVIASVPAFLVVIFVVYSYIILLIRMWRY